MDENENENEIDLKDLSIYLSIYSSDLLSIPMHISKYTSKYKARLVLSYLAECTVYATPHHTKPHHTQRASSLPTRRLLFDHKEREL